MSPCSLYGGGWFKLFFRVGNYTANCRNPTIVLFSPPGVIWETREKCVTSFRYNLLSLLTTGEVGGKRWRGRKLASVKIPFHPFKPENLSTFKHDVCTRLHGLTNLTTYMQEGHKRTFLYMQEGRCTVLINVYFNKNVQNIGRYKHLFVLINQTAQKLLFFMFYKLRNK